MSGEQRQVAQLSMTTDEDYKEIRDSVADLMGAWLSSALFIQ